MSALFKTHSQDHSMVNRFPRKPVPVSVTFLQCRPALRNTIAKLSVLIEGKKQISFESFLGFKWEFDEENSIYQVI